MAGKRQNKIVYYTGPGFSEEVEVPIHIQRVNLKADFNDATKVEIIAILHNQNEVEMWRTLVDQLTPYKE